MFINQSVDLRRTFAFGFATLSLASVLRTGWPTRGMLRGLRHRPGTVCGLPWRVPVAPSTRAASLIARSGSVHHEKRCSSWPVICRGAAQKLAHVQSFRFFSLFRSPAAGWNSAASRCSPMMSACSALVVMWIVAECSAPQQVHR